MKNIYSIALRALPLIGDVNFMRLVEITGSAKETWHLSKKLLKRNSGNWLENYKEIGNRNLFEIRRKGIDFCEKITLKLTSPFKELPKLLSNCDDAPAILYKKEV